MPEYINPNNHTVHLTGPDGIVIKVRSKQRIELPLFFERYCARNYIRKVSSVDSRSNDESKAIQARINLNRAITKRVFNRPPATNEQIDATKQRRTELTKTRKLALATKNKRYTPTRTAVIKSRPNKSVVGKTINADAAEILNANLAVNQYPVSDGIGIGILSYNRVNSLRRLVQSILRYTSLHRTTVFISDDASDQPELLVYLDELAQNQNLVIIRNTERLGVAGNSNRLLKCLERFSYGMLLNDDVEILQMGWETFYPSHFNQLGFQHFSYYQPGVYNGHNYIDRTHNGAIIRIVSDKPHGAVLAFTNTGFTKVGYFDEAYGLYGMEHVDWSFRFADMGLQPLAGVCDVIGSNNYFKIHEDQSALIDRSQLFRDAKKVYERRVVEYKNCSQTAANLPSISCVIPVRNTQRSDSIRTVVNNIRGQKFPVIEIVVAEQDQQTTIDVDELMPVNYHLVSDGQPLFNKARAFNVGVLRSKHDVLVLHDADIMAQGHYFRHIYEALIKNEACHFGKRVLYADQTSTETINQNEIVNESVVCERIVGYFEGGSIACRRGVYWNVGGFNEDYHGYGNEDCDFYSRLSGGAVWYEPRSFDFVHLWHVRVSGWQQHHERNKQLELNLNKLAMPDRIAIQKQQVVKNGYLK